MSKKLWIVALILLSFVACRSGRKDSPPPIDPELMAMTKEEAWAKADALYSDKKYAKSRKYFAHVYESYPNDPLGRKSLLRIADSYYGQGDLVSLVEAQYKYRDFINRYPGSEQADYAMLQIANVAFKQMEHHDRDQTKTNEAVEKYQQMIEAFPNSSFRGEAEDKLRQCRNRLARHEHSVARFYLKRGNADAAISRLTKLVETYPDYALRDEAYFDLAMSLDRLGRKGEADLYLERVVTEYPDTETASKARTILAGRKA